MCWSAGASIAATAVGAGATTYATKKKVPKARILALAYFTLMEFLQALSYIWIGQCDVSGNQLLTYFSITHIAFQAPFINAFMLSFAPPRVRKKWFVPAMALSLIPTIMILTKLIVPLIWDAPKELMCRAGVDALCGTKACSYMGGWHLAWRLPMLGFDPTNYSYFVTVFILPLFYGGWRISLFHFIFGPLLAISLTTNRDEAPAIWCLFSIAILSAIFFGPLKRWLETPLRQNNKNAKKK